MQLLLAKEQELGSLAVVECNLDAIEVRKPVACAIPFEVTRILLKYERLSLLPNHELKRTGANGMSPELISIFLNCFLRHDGTILHGENAEYWVVWPKQLQLKSCIVHCREGTRRIYLPVEYPCAGTRGVSVDDPSKTVLHIECGHLPANSVDECFVIMKVYIVAEKESV